MNISNTPIRSLDSRASFFISERSFQKPTRQSLRASTLTLAEGLLISTKSVRKWMMLKVCELGAGHIFQALLPRYERCVTAWPAQCMRVWHHTCNRIPWNCCGFCCVVWPSERLRTQSGAFPEPPGTGFMFFAEQNLFGGWMDSEIAFTVNPWWWGCGGQELGPSPISALGGRGAICIHREPQTTVKTPLTTHSTESPWFLTAFHHLHPPKPTRFSKPLCDWFKSYNPSHEVP